MNNKEIEMVVGNWNQLAQDRSQKRTVMNTTMWTNLWLP